MAHIAYLVCEKCREIEQYDELDDGTTSIERGHFLVHRDYMVSGLKSQEEAEKWLADHPFQDGAK